MSDGWRADLVFRPDGRQLRVVGVVETLQAVISGLVVGGHVMPQSTREASEI